MGEVIETIAAFVGALGQGSEVFGSGILVFAFGILILCLHLLKKYVDRKREDDHIARIIERERQAKEGPIDATKNRVPSMEELQKQYDSFLRRKDKGDQ